MKGTYGSATGLSTAACSGQCQAGSYGSNTARIAASCDGQVGPASCLFRVSMRLEWLVAHQVCCALCVVQCTAQYYCPAGSTSATQNP